MEAFLTIGDYSELARDYLMLVPDLRYNYLEALKAKYYKANSNMFELIANEVRKVKESHSLRLGNMLNRLLLANPQLVFSVEYERMKNNYWMPAIQGGHSLNALEFLEENLRKYHEWVKTEEDIEASRIEILDMRSRAYRTMSPNTAMNHVEEALNKSKGELGKALFAKSESVQIRQGEVGFWESELFFHKKRAQAEIKQDTLMPSLKFPKPKAKHYALAYVFDCHATGVVPKYGCKKELERIGNRLMGEGKGNTFYKAVNDATDLDQNSETNLLDFGGEGWRDIVLSISTNREGVEKYLKVKGL
jgi:hypothetical protein